MKVTPEDIANAQVTNGIASEMAQALYDRVGMTHAIVITIAMMAILLHNRAKQVGGSGAFKEQCRRVAEALVSAPEDFIEMLTVHDHPDDDTSRKPN